MGGTFYLDAFGRRGTTVRPPACDDVADVHEKHMSELIPAQYLPETRAGVLEVIERLAAAGVDGVLLAGAELPLLDTTRLHVRPALLELLA